MKRIYKLLLFFLICGCNRQPHIITYEEQIAGEHYSDSIRERSELAHFNSENQKIDTIVKIIQFKEKTTRNFENYFEITIENVGERAISSIQIASVTFFTVKFESNNPSYNINLLPGKSTIIKHPFAKLSSDQNINKGQYPIVTKVRFSNGEYLERDENLERGL